MVDQAKAMILQASSNAQPVARGGMPDDIANAVAFLASGSLSHRFAQNGTAPDFGFRIWSPFLETLDNEVVEIAKNIKPSPRGEYEITDINLEYLNRGKLSVSVLDRGTAWLDTGTFDSLMQASQFIQVIEQRQGIKVACIEEIAWRKGFIDTDQLVKRANPLLKSGYGKYMMDLLN